MTYIVPPAFKFLPNFVINLGTYKKFGLGMYGMFP